MLVMRGFLTVQPTVHSAQRGGQKHPEAGRSIQKQTEAHRSRHTHIEAQKHTEDRGT